jgi:hexosaminidase
MFIHFISFLDKLGIAVSNKTNLNVENQTKRILLWTNSSLGGNPGLYHLSTDASKETITVIGQSSAAVYYGVQSLLSLVAGSPDNKSIPFVLIEDEPRFEHRGMHVDVSRNFRTKADIIRLMDGMAMYKMNKLHLHLSDDEGWRIEIPGLPELTEV